MRPASEPRVSAPGAGFGRAWGAAVMGLLGLGLLVVARAQEPLRSAAQAVDLQWQASQGITAAGGSGQHEPAFLLDSDGALNVLWVDDSLGPSSLLLAARREADAAAWSDPQRVQGLPASMPGAEATVLAAPSVAEGPDGRLHAVWVQRRRLGAEVWHASRAAGARSWTRPSRVDAGSPLDRADPAVVVDPANVCHVIWAEGRSESDIVHSRAAAAASWSLPQRVNTPAEGRQHRPVLVAAPDGNLYAAWEDNREGRTSVAASRLPPGGDVWWPNAILGASADGATASRAPVLALDRAGLPSLLWIEERGLGRLRKAGLPAPDAYWRDQGVLYQAERGRLKDLAWSALAEDAGAVLWTEERSDPQGDRLYSAVLEAGTLGGPRRVDLGRDLGHAEAPHSLIDGLGRLVALWSGRSSGEPEARLRLAMAEPPLVASMRRQLQGRLVYAARPLGCPTEAYALIDCSGAWLAYLRPTGVDLAPYLGSWLAVEATAEPLARCTLLRVETLRMASGPCPSNPAVLTGRLSLMGRPLEGALARVDDVAVRSGPSGRFALAPAPLGRHALELRAPCALPLSLEALRIIDGLNRLPDVALRPGDLDQDCGVGLGDLVLLARQLGLAADLAHPVCADLDGDGSIGIQDLAPIAANLGAACAGGEAPRPAAVGERHRSGADGPQASAPLPDGGGSALRLGARAAAARVWYLTAGPPPQGRRFAMGSEAPFEVVAEGLLTLRNQVTPDGGLELLLIRPPSRPPLPGGATLVRLVGGLEHPVDARLQAADDLGRAVLPEVWWSSAAGPSSDEARTVRLPLLWR